MTFAKTTLHDLAKIDIFNGKNLLFWKHRMNALLHLEDLSYVVKDLEKTIDNAPNDEKEAYVNWEYDNE